MAYELKNRELWQATKETSVCHIVLFGAIFDVLFPHFLQCWNE